MARREGHGKAWTTCVVGTRGVRDGEVEVVEAGGVGQPEVPGRGVEAAGMEGVAPHDGASEGVRCSHLPQQRLAVTRDGRCPTTVGGPCCGDDGRTVWRAGRVLGGIPGGCDVGPAAEGDTALLPREQEPAAGLQGSGRGEDRRDAVRRLRGSGRRGGGSRRHMGRAVLADDEHLTPCAQTGDHRRRRIRAGRTIVQEPSQVPQTDETVVSSSHQAGAVPSEVHRMARCRVRLASNALRDVRGIRPAPDMERDEPICVQRGKSAGVLGQCRSHHPRTRAPCADAEGRDRLLDCTGLIVRLDPPGCQPGFAGSAEP